MKKGLIIVFFSFILIGCKNDQTNEDKSELKRETDLTESQSSIKVLNGKRFQEAERVIGKFHFRYLSMIPVDKRIDQEQISGLLAMDENAQMEFTPGVFKIILDNANGELLQYELKSPDEYKKRVEYYSFNINQDLKLIYGQDTLDCLFSTFQRDFGLSPEITFNCYFEKIENQSLNSEYTIMFEDKYFNCGIVNLVMPSVTYL